MPAHMLRLLLLLLIGPGVAPATAATVSTVKLPGFTISLPSGKIITQTTLPAGGEYKQTIDDRNALPEPSVRVLWYSQAMTRADWRDKFLPMAMELELVDGKPGSVLREQQIDEGRWIAIIGGRDSPIGIGYVVCAPSFSVHVKLRQHRDMTALQAAVVDLVRSVHCEPTPMSSQRPQMSARLPADYGDTSNEKMQRYRSLGGEYITINFSQGNQIADRHAFREFMRGAAGVTISPGAVKESFQYLPLRPRDDGKDAVMIRADLPGRKNATYLTGMYCDEIRLTFMAIIELPRADDPVAETRLQQLYCPGSDGDAVKPFAEVAANACASGNASACRFR